MQRGGGDRWTKFAGRTGLTCQNICRERLIPIYGAGHNRISTPYTTIYLVISLPNIPCIHRIIIPIWFWPTLPVWNFIYPYTTNVPKPIYQEGAGSITFERHVSN